MNYNLGKEYYKNETIDIINKKKGEIISFEYKNSLSKIKIKCLNGHTWETTPKNIKRNVWCPECNIYTSERYCRLLFETIFNDSFIHTKPSWLNYKGIRLELDGYCEKLNIAFEYNGKQHYVFTKKYHKTKNNFLKRIEYDLAKKEICEKNKVTLIVIPYTIQIDKMENFIVNELLKIGIKLPEYKKININDILAESCHLKINEIKKIALSNEGECLSNSYLNNRKKMQFRCKNNHVFSISANTLKNGQWCRECQPSAWTKDEKLKRLNQEILNKNGRLLSSEYITQNDEVKVLCEKNHIFMIKPRYVIQKIMWCPYCSTKGKNKKYIEPA